MHRVVDNVLVASVLLVSFAYAVLSLGPRSLRRRLLDGAAALLLRLPRFLGVRVLARRLGNAAESGSGACGGCDSCGAKPPANAGESMDVGVPLSKIGKRR